MHPGDSKEVSLEEYRLFETQLHHDLMNACRKYISKLSIVSVLGILDVVKQETVELEQATKRTFEKKEFNLDEEEKASIETF